MKINVEKARQVSRTLIILGIIVGFVVVLSRWDFLRFESYIGVAFVICSWLSIIIGLVLPCFE